MAVIELVDQTGAEPVEVEEEPKPKRARRAKKQVPEEETAEE